MVWAIYFGYYVIPLYFATNDLWHTVNLSKTIATTDGSRMYNDTARRHSPYPAFIIRIGSVLGSE